MTDFQVKGGNGRAYFPLREKSKEIENKRRDALAAKGHAWAKEEAMPNGDGFVMVSKRFVDFLTEALERNDKEDFRVNYKFWHEKQEDGRTVVKFQDASYMWSSPGAGNRYTDLRTFDQDEKQGRPHEHLEHSSSAAGPHDAEDVFEDEDIPF